MQTNLHMYTRTYMIYTYMYVDVYNIYTYCARPRTTRWVSARSSRPLLKQGTQTLPSLLPFLSSDSTVSAKYSAVAFSSQRLGMPSSLRSCCEVRKSSSESSSHRGGPRSAEPLHLARRISLSTCTNVLLPAPAGATRPTTRASLDPASRSACSCCMVRRARWIITQSVLLSSASSTSGLTLSPCAVNQGRSVA